jgi:hypothetical protein
VIWSYLATAVQREAVAQNLVAMLTRRYPVYKKNLTIDTIEGACLNSKSDGTCNYANYQLAGYVQLDGIDYDFEKNATLYKNDRPASYAITL